jgi:hypothetical protein
MMLRRRPPFTWVNRLQFRWLQHAPGPAGINSAALLTPSLVRSERLLRERCEMPPSDGHHTRAFDWILEPFRQRPLSEEQRKTYAHFEVFGS